MNLFVSNIRWSFCVFMINIPIIFASTFSFGQTDFGEVPCPIKTLSIIEKIEDSIEMIANYEDLIDLTNQNCRYIIAEGYFNQIPDESFNGLCIFYFEGDPPVTEITYLDLFDKTDKMTHIINKLRFVFISSSKTHIWRTFETAEDFSQLFALDIRNLLK